MFEDAYKSPLSLVLVDDIERLLGKLSIHTTLKTCPILYWYHAERLPSPVTRDLNPEELSIEHKSDIR